MQGQRVRRGTFSGRITGLVLAAVIGTLALCLGAVLWLTAERVHDQAAQNALGIARTVAADPEVRTLVARTVGPRKPRPPGPARRAAAGRAGGGPPAHRRPVRHRHRGPRAAAGPPEPRAHRPARQHGPGRAGGRGGRGPRARHAGRIRPRQGPRLRPRVRARRRGGQRRGAAWPPSPATCARRSPRSWWPAPRPWCSGCWSPSTSSAGCAGSRWGWSRRRWQPRPATRPPCCTASRTASSASAPTG